MRRFAAQLKERPQTVVSLVGYAEDKGSAELAVAMAYRRIEAVAEVLESAGISWRRIRRNAQIEDPSAGASCMAANRRVELRLID